MTLNVLVNVIPRMLYYSWLWQWKYWIFNQGPRRSFPGLICSGNRLLRLRLHGNRWIFDRFDIKGMYWTVSCVQSVRSILFLAGRKFVWCFIKVDLGSGYLLRRHKIHTGWGFCLNTRTDTAAILNLLYLRSIMGCPGGTSSVFTYAFRVKRTLMYISRENGDHDYIQTRHNDLFFPLHCTIFFWENLKKNWPEKCT